MNIKSYVYYNDKCVPGNRAAYFAMQEEKKEYSELSKYDKIIRVLYNIDKNTDLWILTTIEHKKLLQCTFNYCNRELVITTNPDSTYTLQENLENGEINYLIDNCKYQGVFLKKLEKLIKL